MEEFAVEMPLRLRTSRGGKLYTLSWNDYRNWHFHVKNAIKQQYSGLALLLIPAVKWNFVRINYKLIKPDNRTKDRDNFLGLQAKFFQDALVQKGVIPDDSDKHILSSYYCSGDNDKANPRAVITVIRVGC